MEVAIAYFLGHKFSQTALKVTCVDILLVEANCKKFSINQFIEIYVIFLVYRLYKTPKNL